MTVFHLDDGGRAIKAAYHRVGRVVAIYCQADESYGGKRPAAITIFRDAQAANLTANTAMQGVDADNIGLHEARPMMRQRPCPAPETFDRDQNVPFGSEPS